MEIKAYNSGDENEILNLFESCFGKPMNFEYWNWRFKNNPFSENLQIELMWDEGALVGHYAVSPIELIVDNEIILSGLSMTTMTHPKYHGKGVFTKLADSLYKKLSQQKYNLVWGFPNNNSHYGFLKNLNWKNIAVQCTMSLDVKHMKSIKEIQITEHLNFEFVSHLFNKSVKKIRLNKTEKYLNWRYCLNPSSNYKILINEKQTCGIVYKKISSFSDKNKFEIDIMEFFHDNDENSVLSILNFINESNGNICKFNIWDSLFSENQIILEKIGFRLSAHSTYFGYCELNNGNHFEDYKNWDISFGYSDVF